MDCWRCRSPKTVAPLSAVSPPRRSRELLHRRGYAVDVSYDGVSGLDNARSGIYDLVLLDAMLPELDGFSLLQQLRAGGETVPVLMLTASSSSVSKGLVR